MCSLLSSGRGAGGVIPKLSRSLLSDGSWGQQSLASGEEEKPLQRPFQSLPTPAKSMREW